MKTPSPQEAAKMTNRQIAEQIRDEMKLWIAIAITLVISGKDNEVTEAHLTDKIECALDAKELEADKNGYERGRKEDEALLHECFEALGKRDEFANFDYLMAKLKTRLQ